MKNFIYAQVEPKLQKALPEINDSVISNRLFRKFSQIKEFGRYEFQGIKLRSLDMHYNEGIEICYIHKGKYQWLIEDKQYLLYPGDCFITLPWQRHGSPKGFFDIGQISWIIIRPDKFDKNGNLRLGSWSTLSRKKQKQIGQVLVTSNKQHFPNKGLSILFNHLSKELQSTEFAYEDVINHLVDKLFIQLVRSILIDDSKANSNTDAGIGELEKKLKNDLSHKWTLQEMADILQLGQTSLNILIKRETGYSPGQYIMNLRINYAKHKLEDTHQNITDIAFQCGFCSSQHFSAAFKQKTGYTPKEFRKLTN